MIRSHYSTKTTMALFVSLAAGSILEDEEFMIGTMKMHEESDFNGERPVPFVLRNEKLYVMLYDNKNTFKCTDNFFIGTFDMCRLREYPWGGGGHLRSGNHERRSDSEHSSDVSDV